MAPRGLRAVVGKEASTKRGRLHIRTAGSLIVGGKRNDFPIATNVSAAGKTPEKKGGGVLKRKEKSKSPIEKRARASSACPKNRNPCWVMPMGTAQGRGGTYVLHM